MTNEFELNNNPVFRNDFKQRAIVLTLRNKIQRTSFNSFYSNFSLVCNDVSFFNYDPGFLIKSIYPYRVILTMLIYKVSALQRQRVIVDIAHSLNATSTIIINVSLKLSISSRNKVTLYSFQIRDEINRDIHHLQSSYSHFDKFKLCQPINYICCQRVGLVVSRVGSWMRGHGFDSRYLDTFSI